MTSFSEVSPFNKIIVNNPGIRARKNITKAANQALITTLKMAPSRRLWLKRREPLECAIEFLVRIIYWAIAVILQRAKRHVSFMIKRMKFHAYQKMSLKGHLYSNGFKLQYIVEGDGPPAIVIGSSLYYSRTFSNNLRNHLKLVFADHRGFSPPYDCQDISQFQLETLVDDIELVRKELGLDKVIVIGHSGHAFMALEYAKKYPDRVSGVVMMCVGPNYSLEGHAAAERYLNDSVCPERKAVLAQNLALLPQAIAAAPEKAFITYCLLMGPKSWFDYHYDAAQLWEGVEVNMAMFDYVWGEVFRDIDITENLDKLLSPAFLALGRYDYLVPPAYLWEGIRNKFSNLTIRVFEKSSHAPQFEEPELFDKELLAWLFKS